MDDFLNTISEFFFLNNTPLIVMDPYGHNCIFNKESEKIFKTPVLDDITEFFPTIDLDIKNPDQICIKSESGIEYTLNLTFYQSSEHWIIEIKNSMETEWDEYVNSQKILHVLFLELISINNEDQLYKKLISKARELLKIDRIGILLYDIKSNLIHCSWGTNENGVVKDQEKNSLRFSPDEVFQSSIHHKDFLVYSEDTDLYDDDHVVGRGWNTKTAFYSGGTPVGWISCDNLLSGKPLSRWKKEILVELSKMTGELIFNLRIENQLQDQVDKKTKQLKETIKELKETQESLIQSEKLASLGLLTAGIAHEINTPIGISLTSTSHTYEKTVIIMSQINGETLKKKDLTDYFDDTLHSSEIAVKSLKKAGELINIFKQLSVDQDSDVHEKVNIKDLIQNILLTMKHTNDLENINIKLDSKDDIILDCNPSNIYQILSNLIKNSILHGFKDTATPIIDIKVFKENSNTIILYKDNGSGIPKRLHKKVFEPFYTTKRGSGGTGLGLNIIYNNVLNLGGLISLSTNEPSGVVFRLCI